MKTDIDLYPILLCPLIIGEENTKFYLLNEEVSVSVPHKLMKELVALCDGTHSVGNLVKYFSKDWEVRSLENLFDHLIRSGVLINSRDTSSYVWQFFKNPTAWKPELSKATLGDHMLLNPLQIGGKGEDCIEKVHNTTWTKLLHKRRSVRFFGGGRIEKSSFIRMLWSGYGVIKTSIAVGDEVLNRRTVPSAGALQQLVLHVCLFKNIEDIKSGIYRVVTNKILSVELVYVSSIDEVRNCFVEQNVLNAANGCIFISGDVHRSAVKYGNRAILYTALEAGHAAQNIHLCAQLENIGSVEIGGFFEDKLAEVLKITTNIQPIISIIFGSLPDSSKSLDNSSKKITESNIVRNVVVEDPTVHNLSLPFSMVFAEAITPKTGGIWWSCGRDKNRELAKTKALAEACEWYLCGQPTDVKFVEASLVELSNDAIDPNTMYSYLPEQTGKGKKVHKFDPKAIHEWVKVKSLFSGGSKYVLADFVFFPYTPKFGNRYAYANSSGVAAHRSIELAIEHAVLEIIEREAFMVTWLNKLRRPVIRKESLSRDLRGRIKHLKDLGFRIRLVDITYDFTPVVMIVVSHKQKPFMSVATASGYDVEVVVNRAMSEVEASVYCRLRDGESRTILTEEEIVSTMDHGGYYEDDGRIKQAEFLFGDSQKMITTTEMVKWNRIRSSENLYASIKNNNLDVYVCDLKELRKNIDIPYEIMRVFIPGMVPISFGHGIEPLGLGRVLSLPFELGICPKREGVRILNRSPHPFT